MRLPLEIHRARKLSLTPLVDVIFLLLLFFMLSSTFTRFGQVELATGQAGGPSLAQPDVLIVVSSADIRVNGEVVTGEDGVSSRLIQLQAMGAETVLVRVDETATSEALIAVLETARNSTNLAFTVAR